MQVVTGGENRDGPICPGSLYPPHRLYKFLTIDRIVLNYIGLDYPHESITLYQCDKCGGAQDIYYRENVTGIDLIKHFDVEDPTFLPYEPYPDFFDEFVVNLIEQSEEDQEFARQEYAGTCAPEFWQHERDWYTTDRYQVGGFPYLYQEPESPCISCGSKYVFLAAIPDWNGSEKGFLNSRMAVTTGFFLCPNCFLIAGFVAAD